MAEILFMLKFVGGVIMVLLLGWFYSSTSTAGQVH